MNRSSPFPIQRLEVDADRTHVADDLRLRFLEGEIQAVVRRARQAALAKCAATLRLARARRARHQHAAAPEDSLCRRASSSSRGMPVRDPLVDDRVREAERGDRQHGDARPRRSGTDTRWCRASRRGTSPPAVVAWRPGRSTRWSSRITQSETYSSSPWRVSVASPRSPVMTAVTPLSFSQRNSRRSSARSIAWFGQPGEERLDGVEHDALGADRVDRVPEPDEQPFEVVLAGSPRSRCARRGRDRDELCFRADQSCPDRIPATRRSFRGPRPSPRSDINTPGSPNSSAPRTRNSIASRRLAAAGAAADERRPPARQAAAGDLVEAGDAGRRPRERNSSRWGGTA